MKGYIKIFKFAHPWQKPTATAVLKQQPEDFIVTEQISFPLTGTGEHIWFWVQKTNQNSEWAGKQLAKFCGITNREVGIAGKKDNHGETYQWISLHLPQKDNPDFSKINIQGVKVLRVVRHNKKLQTGGLSGNNFKLILRELKGNKQNIEQRLDIIKEQGFANYFGEQRFGNDFENLNKATAFFTKQIRPKRYQKTMYLSAARSWIFNEILSARIDNKSWNQYQQGDIFQLEGSQKWFVDDNAENLKNRVADLDIHPTGALIGKGGLLTKNTIVNLENKIIAQHPIWKKGLESVGMKQERRALRVVPKNLNWLWLDDKTLELKFFLSAGSYATMLVRELVQV
jgi:tRNA pseudouridine13 synthase